MILALKRPPLPAIPALPPARRPWELALRRIQTLESERVRLVPLEPADAELLFPIVTHPKVVAHWDCETLDEPELVADMVDGQVLEMACGRGFYWSARTPDGRFLGACELAELDRTARRGEVGFVFAPQAWSDGLAEEALRLVLKCASGLGLRRLEGRACLGDRRAEALLQKVGFRQKALMRGPTIDDERRDRRLFTLTLKRL